MPNDLDLGSGGVLLLPDQSGAHPHEMVSAGKDGTIYLVNRDNMGHFNANNDQIVQSLPNIFPGAWERRRQPQFTGLFQWKCLFQPGRGHCPGVPVEQRIVVHGADLPILGDLRVSGRNAGHFRQRQH